MLTKLSFALIIIVDGVQQPDVSYWADILRCNQFAEWVEHGYTHSKDKRSKKKRRDSQVNITAYCKPVYVNENVILLD
tara:strand:+ start:1021 stop:1254 length:234 start_codon:yes stop_codon:yes gene_type:complete